MLNKHMLERKSLDIKGEVLDKEDFQELITFSSVKSRVCLFGTFQNFRASLVKDALAKFLLKKIRDQSKVLTQVLTNSSSRAPLSFL